MTEAEGTLTPPSLSEVEEIPTDETPDYKTMAFEHVLQLLKLDDEAVIALYNAKITSIRRLIVARMDHLQILATDSFINLELSDIDQIYFFKRWYSKWSKEGNTYDYEELISCLTEKDWISFCDQETNLYANMFPPFGGGTGPGSSPSNPIVLEEQEAPSIKVSLKDYPNTSGKSTECPQYKRKFISTATTGGHAELLDKNYKVPDPKSDPRAHARYVKLNSKTFSAIDAGTSGGTLWSIVNKYRATLDGRGAFLHLDKHQRGQGCEETCANNAFEELQALRLTPQFPGEAEAFVNT